MVEEFSAAIEKRIRSAASGREAHCTFLLTFLCSVRVSKIGFAGIIHLDLIRWATYSARGFTLQPYF